MEFVDEPMRDGREDDSRKSDEQQSAEQRVAAGEQFPGRRVQRRDRTHAGKNHRRVHERIQP